MHTSLPHPPLPLRQPPAPAVDLALPPSPVQPDLNPWGTNETQREEEEGGERIYLLAEQVLGHERDEVVPEGAAERAGELGLQLSLPQLTLNKTPARVTGEEDPLPRDEPAMEL